MNKDWSAFNRLNKRRDDIYSLCAKKAGLTETRFRVLYAICEKGVSISQNAFCENWCYSKQTVNAAVAGLQNQGLLYLKFAEGSKKQKDIFLTEKGKAFCQKHIIPVLEAECKAVSSLEEEERLRFISIEEKLLDALENEFQTLKSDK